MPLYLTVCLRCSKIPAILHGDCGKSVQCVQAHLAQPCCCLLWSLFTVINHDAHLKACLCIIFLVILFYFSYYSLSNFMPQPICFQTLFLPFSSFTVIKINRYFNKIVDFVITNVWLLLNSNESFGIAHVLNTKIFGFRIKSF